MLSSSSSSKSSSSSSSSSSSMCCTMLYCNGQACSDFSNWNLNGLHPSNTDNCSLYVVFDVLGDYQQVSLYDDLTYSHLVAIGQSNVSGNIYLNPRNSSGINGTVSWSGVKYYYPVYASISCLPFSTSSSDSSIDSSSSSSYSSQTESSISSNCCTNPVCQGSASVHFSSWYLEGSNIHNTEACNLYLDFDYIGGNQHIGIYNDISRADAYLVAEGQGAATGTINLVERNGSGLSGTVFWDGVIVLYPSASLLTCFPLSSSSSSSISDVSNSSRSSQSHSSISSSFSSSSSSSSTSSTSSSLTSSSSSSSLSSHSISTSSSSYSNSMSSSSSSSSHGGWNKGKPLLLGLSAINALGVTNKLAQTITIVDSFYDIGKVYCYFYGTFGLVSSYNIHLDIYACDDNGKPQDLISSSTLAGSSINGNDWYCFDVNISGSTPSNKFLSFVVWQENGSENDYVLWGYYGTDTTGTPAWLSNDGLNWQSQSNVVRALKVVGNFQAYDSTNFRLLSPPATLQQTVGSIEDGVNDGTKFINGSYQYAPDKIVINNASLILSFVIDSSGSMGWNDRFSTRKEFVSEIVQKFKTIYPKDVMFDFVKFGGIQAQTNNISSQIGMPVTININLADPNRISYSFDVISANATKGDIYSSNGYSFTVTDEISSGSVLSCMSNSGSLPYDAGTLIKVSGAGDPTIDYTSVSFASLSDGMVAFGFKNFEDSNDCNISDIVIGDFIPDLLYDSEGSRVVHPNWQSITIGGSIELSAGNNGPKDSSSIDFTSYGSLEIRRLTTNVPLQKTKILSDVYTGATTVNVENIDLFANGSKIDFVDQFNASMGHTVISNTNSTVVVTPPLICNIYGWDNGGGIAQQSNLNKSLTINGITANLLFKDASSTRSITMFFQTINGLLLEYDFKPLKEWAINNLFWVDETASLPLSVFDTDGNPFPNGTKIILYVDKDPAKEEAGQIPIPTQKLVEDAFIGSDKIYVDSTSEFAREMEIDIYESDVVSTPQHFVITEVGNDVGGSYIKLDPSLAFNFLVANGARIVASTTSDQLNSLSANATSANTISSVLNIVDVTPMVTGRNLDPSLLKPYDLTPLSPSTLYSELNLDREHVSMATVINVPSIDGKAVIQILPITDDNLKTVKQKNEESLRLLRLSNSSSVSYFNQVLQNEEDPLLVSNNVSSSLKTLTTSTTTLDLSHGSDYNIENPVYLQDGLATSSMVTFSTKFEPKLIKGMDVELLVKEYDIYPSMVFESANGTPLVKQYFPQFIVDFTPSVFINSKYSGPTVAYVSCYVPAPTVECTEPVPASPDQCVQCNWVETAGVHATGDGFAINYIVTDKNQYVVNGQLRIRIYTYITDNPLDYLGQFISPFQDLNVKLPNTTVVDSSGQQTIVQPVTEITNWRYIVENNPYSQIIESANSNSIATLFQANVSSATISAFAANTASNVVQSNTSSSAFFTTANPLYWANAAQYGILHDTTINVINGQATLTIPVSDVVSLLCIQASYYFGENDRYEAIRSDLIPVANPIGIGLLDPEGAVAVGGDTSYETGVFISWKQKGPLIDGTPALLSPIEDNVVVNFTAGSPRQQRNFGPTPMVSKTSNGRAGGIYMSPHPRISRSCNCTLLEAIADRVHVSAILKPNSRVELPQYSFAPSSEYSPMVSENVPGEDRAGTPLISCCFCNDFCRCWGACYETNISVSYLGYTAKDRRVFEWSITTSSSDTSKEAFVQTWMYVNASSNSILVPPDNPGAIYNFPNKLIPVMYADDTSSCDFKVELADPTNVLWIEQGLPLDGHNIDRMKGYNQGVRSTPTNIGVGFLEKRVTVSQETGFITVDYIGYKQKDGLDIVQSQNLWLTDNAYFSVSNLNTNIGRTIDTFIRIGSSYCDPKIKVRAHPDRPEDGYTNCISVYGEIYHPLPKTSEHSVVEFPPEIIIKEPLSIYLHVESYYEQVIKDGVTSYNIVADVRWKGEPINGKFIKNQGQPNETVIDFPFPTVSFEAGLFGESLREDDRGTSRQIGSNSEGVFLARQAYAQYLKDTSKDTSEDGNSEDGNLEDGSFNLDRGVSVKNSSDISLDSYSAIVSLSRTDIYYGNGTDGLSPQNPSYTYSQEESHTHMYEIDSFGNGNSIGINQINNTSAEYHVHIVTFYTIMASGTDSHKHNSSHTHSCVVDGNGNGITDSMIILAGVPYPDHVHIISDYVANAVGDIGTIHSHKLRSVAVVKLNPMSNLYTETIINGVVVYDPTSCLPYHDLPVPPYYPSTFAQGNRMMFESLYIPPFSFKAKELLMEINQTGLSITSRTITETNKQNQISVSAKYSSYSQEINNQVIMVPESPVPDGTRIVFEISCFKPNYQTSNQPLVIIPDKFREYMLIEVKATVYTDGLIISNTCSQLIRSDLNWFPVVDGLVGEPTNDDIYISEVLPRIETMGASQVHDAVKLASQRLIQYKTDYPQWASAKKAIFLLTDGDENTSQYSLDQAINNVNFIDGNCEVPVIPIRLGYSYSTDEIIMEKYKEETCSKSFNFIDATNTDITNVITNIISRDVLGNNNGIYTNTIDIGSDNLASVISMENLLLPIGSKILFRYRFSSDNISWSTWSEWFDSSIVKEFSLDLTYKARYIQYQVHLYGNSDFESPELYAGITLDYFKKETFTMFFQPIDLDINTDEYLASMHITHKATVPTTSIINYGYSQTYTTDIIDYSSVTRPLIVPDRHTILLSRYNEMLITQNYISYFAINGSWVDGAIIQIYKISNGLSQLVDSSKYTVNSKKGLVTFSNLQNRADTFVICITLDPAFRITCNIINYGPKPVIVDHIGILYNTTKRIPTDNNGSIINIPISKRIS